MQVPVQLLSTAIDENHNGRHMQKVEGQHGPGLQDVMFYEVWAIPVDTTSLRRRIVATLSVWSDHYLDALQTRDTCWTPCWCDSPGDAFERQVMKLLCAYYQPAFAAQHRPLRYAFSVCFLFYVLNHSFEVAAREFQYLLELVGVPAYLIGSDFPRLRSTAINRYIKILVLQLTFKGVKTCLQTIETLLATSNAARGAGLWCHDLIFATVFTMIACAGRTQCTLVQLAAQPDDESSSGSAVMSMSEALCAVKSLEDEFVRPLVDFTLHLDKWRCTRARRASASAREQCAAERFARQFGLLGRIRHIYTGLRGRRPSIAGFRERGSGSIMWDITVFDVEAFMTHNTDNLLTWFASEIMAKVEPLAGEEQRSMQPGAQNRRYERSSEGRHGEDAASSYSTER